MAPEKKTQLQHWVETWKRTGIALDRIKQHELQHQNEAERLALLDEMLQWACDHAQPRLSSGLVEQQRWFMKMRTRGQSS